MSDERGGVALDGTAGQGQQGMRPRGPTPNPSCYYLYPHEQCTEAFDQWTRLVDGMIAAATKSKAPPSSSSSSVADQGPGCSARGLAPSPDGVLRQSVDPGLVRLVQAEGSLRGGAQGGGPHPQPNNEQPDEDGSSWDRRRLLVSSLGGSNRTGAGVQTKQFDHHSPCCHRGMTPWKDPGKCYSPGLLGLHEEIEDFYGYMRPLPEEQFMRQDIIACLTQIVSELWPSAEVKVFGSFKTDLYLPTSDIDLVVMCDDLDPQMALKMLEQKLAEKNAYDDVKVIKTSVPIVKFIDRRTAVKVDVSFNVQTGISSADFIKNMKGEYAELPYLVLVLKQFLLSRNLLESFNGGISSYCLILLIISYLQLHPDDRKTGNHGDMLIKFLELYGRHFNYLRTGIRIINGGAYFRKDDNEGELGNRFSLLCIEDPFNPANDVGQGCYGAMKVREEFDKAYRELSDAVLPQYQHIQPVGSSFLGRILLMPPEVIQYRRLIREKYHEGAAGRLHLVAQFPFESSSAASDDNRSDDAGSTCSQNSNLSSEQQIVKSSTHTTSSSSVSPGSSIQSENEADMQPDASTRNSLQKTQMKINAASSEPADAVVCAHLENEPCYPQHSANAVVTAPNSAFLHHPPPRHPAGDPTPPAESNHPGHHTSGRSNSWHNTARSQGGPKSSSLPRTNAASAAAPAPSSAGPNAAGNPAAGKTFSQTGRYGNDRRKRHVNRHENSNGGGGGGFASNR